MLCRYRPRPVVTSLRVQVIEEQLALPMHDAGRGHDPAVHTVTQQRQQVGGQGEDGEVVDPELQLEPVLGVRQR